MMKKPLMIMLGLALTSTANAATLTFQQGFDYFGAVDSRYKFDGVLDGSLGSADLEFDGPIPGPSDGGYSHIVFGGVFGPGAEQVPVGPLTVITSATLTGTVTNSFNSATVHRLLQDIGSRPMAPNNIYEAGVAGTFYDPNGFSSAGDGEPQRGELIEWDVTDMVSAWAAGATNHGFIIFGDTDDGGAISSSNDADGILGNAVRPLLTVEFTQIPEPSSIAIVSLATLGLVARRRRVG